MEQSHNEAKTLDDASSPSAGAKNEDGRLAALCKEVPIPYIDAHSTSIKTTLSMVRFVCSTYGVFLKGVAMFITAQMQADSSVIQDITKRGIKGVFHCYRWVSYLMQKYPMDWDTTRQQCTSITSNIRDTLCALTRVVREEYIQTLVKEKEAGEKKRS